MKCNSCEFCDQIPNCCVSSCNKRNVSLMEPIEFLYSKDNCNDYKYDPSKPKFLDCNHKILNIPEHLIERIIAFKYTPQPGKLWIKELVDRITLNMRRYIERITQYYGHVILNSIRLEAEDVYRQIKGMFSDETRVDDRNFWIECANTYLVSFQCRVWKCIEQFNNTHV